MSHPENLVDAIYAALALLGAVGRVILRGVWTVKTLVSTVASIAIAVPIAYLILYYTGMDKEAPLVVNGSVFTVVGVLGMTIFERLETLRLAVTLGGITVESDDPTQQKTAAPINPAVPPVDQRMEE